MFARGVFRRAKGALACDGYISQIGRTSTTP
jgi:hypothetical protein